MSLSVTTCGNGERQTQQLARESGELRRARWRAESRGRAAALIAGCASREDGQGEDALRRQPPLRQRLSGLRTQGDGRGGAG